MSNHSGSILLNRVLKALVGHKVFATIGNTASRRVIRKIIKLAKEEDCNEYEIIEDVGRKFYICERCLENTNVIKKGICLKCAEEEKKYE